MACSEQVLQRDMSYRKPVPKFIPSPPASPLSPFTQLADTLTTTATTRELPPLPTDWREVIGRATGCKERWTPNGHPPNTCDNLNVSNVNTLDLTNGEVQQHSPTVTISVCTIPELESMTLAQSSDYGDYDPASRPESPTPWSSLPHTTMKRKPPADYRPPTPPLPTRRRRSRSSNAVSIDSPAPSMISHLVPPDRSIAESSHHRRPSVSPPTPPPMGSSVRDVPILLSQNEKTESISMREQSSRWSSAACTPAFPSGPLPLDDKWADVHPAPSSSIVVTPVTPQYPQYPRELPKTPNRLKRDAELPPLPGPGPTTRRLFKDFNNWLRAAIKSAFCL